MRVLSDSGDYVSVEAADSSGDDILAIVDVRTRGFTGRIDTWILRAAWVAFCEQLSRLEADRQGVATVESMSPQELRLTIRSIDRAGHMAIEGVVGYRGTFGEVLLSFSPMEFDPSILPQLLREARAIALERARAG
jgi:hypothetical protein